MNFPFGSKKKTASKLSLSPSLSKKLDHKLISKIQRRNIPSPAQLKYVGRFLSSKEKRLLAILATISILTTLITGGIFLSSHLTTVPTAGGDYREALIGEPKYINPLFASVNDVDSDLASLIYSGLFRYNDQRELVPDLAQDMKISPDGKTYDITLKPNIHWSDGVELKADDVVYTFQTIQNPEVDSPLYNSFQGAVIKKTGDLSIRFTLKQAFAPFVHSLTVDIIPQHIWQIIEKPGAFQLAKANLQPVGTGPWKFDKLVKGGDGTIETYILSRNENYYGQKSYLKTLTFIFFPDITTAISKLHNKDVDALAIPPLTDKSLLSSHNLKTYPIELPQYTALFFNTQDDLLKDKDIRTALRSGTNKDLILKEALGEQGTLVNSPILPGMIGYNPDLKPTPFDPAGANTLLDKKWNRIQPEEYFKLRKDALLADYKSDVENELKAKATSTTSSVAISKDDLAAADQQLTEAVQKEMDANQTFYRKDKNNHVLSITITTLDTPEQQKVAETVAKQWQLLGITTVIQRVSTEQMSHEVLRGHTYQVLLFGELVGGDPDPFPLWHSSQIAYPGLNITQFYNRNADKLLEDARSSLDPKARSEAYKKFQDILTDEIPAIFLYTPEYTFMISDDIKNVRVNKLVRPSDRFNTISDWYNKTKLVWK